MAQGGYKLRIKGFVPVDHNDPDAAMRVLAVIKAAKSGDVKALADLIQLDGNRFDELDLKAVSTSAAPGSRKSK